MMATLLIGDYLFVSKYTYGYSRYSFPFSPPLFTGRDPILGKGPQRGDVVVFRLPRDDSTDYIKRVIGLPGDRIQMIDGVLNINGQPIKRERAEDYVGTEDGPGSSESSAGRRRCRTASSTIRSIWSITRSTTTRRSTRCLPIITS
jgi:signal peptidase I